jgi:DNA-directed RNA polymerase specialized sigma24 family protein
MEQDTDIGGPGHRFPITSQSAIIGVRSQDRELRQRAFETILASYWKPAYKYIRLKWQASNEDAKDLTQGFFALAIEKNYFASYDSTKASFQTFLRTCLDGFVANQKKSEQRLKRGGTNTHFSLDFLGAEHELAEHGLTAGMTPEDYFHREWIRSLFTLAIETLRTHCEDAGHGTYFKIFEAYDLRDDDSPKITYAALAQEFELNTTDVNNYLAAARRDFRRIVLEKLRELTATEEEFEREARTLLGMKKTK